MEKVLDTTTELTELEKAEQVIAEANKAILQDKLERINAILAEGKPCELIVSGQFRGNQVVSNISIDFKK